jgi:hypothetical protein
MYFSSFFQKLGFRIFQFSRQNYMATYDYLYLLDSEKPKVYFLSWFLQEKKSLDVLGPKTSDKNPKNDHF